MRIAVTYEQELVGQHFGRTEQFKIYDTAEGKIISSQIIDTNGTGHGALAGFLRAARVLRQQLFSLHGPAHKTAKPPVFSGFRAAFSAYHI